MYPGESEKGPRPCSLFTKPSRRRFLLHSVFLVGVSVALRLSSTGGLRRARQALWLCLPSPTDDVSRHTRRAKALDAGASPSTPIPGTSAALLKRRGSMVEVIASEVFERAATAGAGKAKNATAAWNATPGKRPPRKGPVEGERPWTFLRA